MTKKKLKLMALDLGAAELLDKENQLVFGAMEVDQEAEVKTQVAHL